MVPSDWDMRRIDAIADVCSGGTPSRKKPSYWGGEIPWVTTTEVHFNRIQDTEQTITKVGLENSSAKFLPPGTILLAMYGQGKTRGQVAILDIEATTNQACAAINLKPGYSSEYYFQYLQSLYFRIRSLSNSGGQDNLSGALVKSIRVAVPPREEQEKIAEILSTWDQAIETTEKLIENSKAQKKALMQQLLTGKKRLPGFSDEWSETVLKNIAAVLVSPVDKKSVTGEPPVRLCNYTDVYYNSHITNDLDFMSATASASEVERFALQKNDVIITKDSETPGDIAVPALVSEELDGVVCGYHLAIIRPDVKVADGAYLNHLFSLPKVRHYFSTRANGVTRFGLTIDGIKEASFLLPGIEEQQNIAGFFDACDQELHFLNMLAQKLMAEKRALMQQLLTGKRRVKVAA